MNLKPFGCRRRLAAEKTDNCRLRADLVAARRENAHLAAERDWYREQWAEASTQATQAGQVVRCLESQLAEARREAIPRSAVDSSSEPTPIFNEVTQDMPLPGLQPPQVPDPETTHAFRVLPLPAALGART